LWSLGQPGAHRVHSDVLTMILIVLKIANEMIAETRLPNGPAFLHAKREPSLDELHGAFQGNLLCGREEQMDVIGHDDKFVQPIFLLVAIVSESFDQKVGGRLAPEDRLTVSGDGGDEEGAVGVHSEMVAGMGERCL